MPLPKPNSDEREKEFISRCMSDEKMNSEFPKQDQRAAVCYRQWNNNRKDESIENVYKKYIE